MPCCSTPSPSNFEGKIAPSQFTGPPPTDTLLLFYLSCLFSPSCFLCVPTLSPFASSFWEQSFVVATHFYTTTSSNWNYSLIRLSLSWDLQLSFTPLSTTLPFHALSIPLLDHFRTRSSHHEVLYCYCCFGCSRFRVCISYSHWRTGCTSICLLDIPHTHHRQGQWYESGLTTAWHSLTPSSFLPRSKQILHSRCWLPTWWFFEIGRPHRRRNHLYTRYCWIPETRYQYGSYLHCRQHCQPR